MGCTGDKCLLLVERCENTLFDGDRSPAFLDGLWNEINVNEGKEKEVNES